MIARVWRGITPIGKADQYLEYLNQTVVPGYQAAGGNEGFFIFREVQGELAYFLLLSLWSSCVIWPHFPIRTRNWPGKPLKSRDSWLPLNRWSHTTKCCSSSCQVRIRHFVPTLEGGAKFVQPCAANISSTNAWIGLACACA